MRTDGTRLRRRPSVLTGRQIHVRRQRDPVAHRHPTVAEHVHSRVPLRRRGRQFLARQRHPLLRREEQPDARPREIRLHMAHGATVALWQATAMGIIPVLMQRWGGG